jgi:hypothetical protein
MSRFWCQRINKGGAGSGRLFRERHQRDTTKADRAATEKMPARFLMSEVVIGSGHGQEAVIPIGLILV